MSRTNDKLSSRGATAGFTLLELIVSMSLSLVVFAAIFSGFTFLGRNLSRMVNTRDQEAKSRSAYYLFDKDVSVATEVSEASDTKVSLTMKDASGNPYTVIYEYTGSTLTRTGRTTPVLSNLAAFDFNYFNKTGDPVAATSSPLSVKEIEFTFTSMLGGADNGTRSRYTAVSPRLLLRNKTLLE